MEEDWFAAYRREVYEDMSRSPDPTMPEEMSAEVEKALQRVFGDLRADFEGPEAYTAIRSALMREGR